MSGTGGGLAAMQDQHIGLPAAQRGKGGRLRTRGGMTAYADALN